MKLHFSFVIVLIVHKSADNSVEWLENQSDNEFLFGYIYIRKYKKYIIIKCDVSLKSRLHKTI